MSSIRNRLIRWACLYRSLIVLLPFILTIARGEETNAAAKPAAPASGHAILTPQDLAMRHERAGRKREAAVLYEQIVRTNTAARKVLSSRLVTIYTEIGETNKALTWAHEVMRSNPEPQTYLAGVHTRLGQFKAAQDILEREIASNTNSTRAVTLRWQLADVFEKAGDEKKARKILDEAAIAAKGTQMEPAAQKRLKAESERKIRAP